MIVILQHLAERLFTGWFNGSLRWFNAGRTGVALFFLVSGFIIPQSLERPARSAGSGLAASSDSIRSIGRACWWSCSCGAAGDYPLSEWDARHWTKLILVNLTMFQEYLGIPHAIHLYWTLSLEMLFYIACSVLFTFGVNRRSILWGWVALGMILVLGLAQPGDSSQAAGGAAGDRGAGLRGDGHVPRDRGRMSVEECRGAARRMRRGVCSGAGDRVSDPRVAATGDWTSVSMITSYLPAPMIFLVLLALRRRHFAFPLRWLGAISYSLYLLHYPVILMLHRMRIGWTWAAAVIVASIAVASASYLLIERPAIAFGRELYPGTDRPLTKRRRRRFSSATRPLRSPPPPLRAPAPRGFRRGVRSARLPSAGSGAGRTGRRRCR